MNNGLAWLTNQVLQHTTRGMGFPLLSLSNLQWNKPALNFGKKHALTNWVGTVTPHQITIVLLQPADLLYATDALVPEYLPKMGRYESAYQAYPNDDKLFTKR